MKENKFCVNNSSFTVFGDGMSKRKLRRMINRLERKIKKQFIKQIKRSKEFDELVKKELERDEYIKKRLL